MSSTPNKRGKHDWMHDTACCLWYSLDSSRAGRQAVPGKRSARGSLRSFCLATQPTCANVTSVTAPGPLVQQEAVLPASVHALHSLSALASAVSCPLSSSTGRSRAFRCHGQHDGLSAGLLIQGQNFGFRVIQKKYALLKNSANCSP